MRNRATKLPKTQRHRSDTPIFALTILNTLRQWLFLQYARSSKVAKQMLTSASSSASSSSPPTVSPPPPPYQLFANIYAHWALLDLNYRRTSTCNLPITASTAGPEPGTLRHQRVPLDLNLQLSELR